MSVSGLLATSRCLTELGIATTVGGNFARRTRTLPGSIQLELSMGNFAKALAPGLLLITLALGLAVLSIRFDRRPR
jgi:tungstate transport system permease protein